MQNISIVSILVPYGYEAYNRGASGSKLHFNCYEEIKPTSREHIIFYGYMRLQLRQVNNRIQLELLQSFPANTLDTKITRDFSFDYYWNKERVYITKRLGTTDVPKVRKQMEALLAECQRFYFLYCTPPQ